MQYIASIILPLLIAAFGGGTLGAVIKAWLDRKKTSAGVEKTEEEKNKLKEENKNIVINQVNEVLKWKNERIEELEGKVHKNEKAITECEYDRKVLKLQIGMILKEVKLSNIPKSTIFILDDNEIVVAAFRFAFKEIPVLDTRCFTHHKTFLEAAKEEQPPMMILDYLLDEETTAEDVIKELGYMPKIFIMSSNKKIQLKMGEQGFWFFYKSDNYISDIANAVIDYLQQIN